MADQALNPAAQNADSKPDHLRRPDTEFTQEQVRALADRVYTMLLRDVKQEQERDRSSIWNSRIFNRG
jgi:hypothetical protein